MVRSDGISNTLDGALLVLGLGVRRGLVVVVGRVLLELLGTGLGEVGLDGFLHLGGDILAAVCGCMVSGLERTWKTKARERTYGQTLLEFS